MKQYIRYKFLKKIFICKHERYINKCLQIKLIDIPEKLMNTINII